MYARERLEGRRGGVTESSQRRVVSVACPLQRDAADGGLITVIAVVILGLFSRQYSQVFPEFVATYAGDTLWALAAFLGIGMLFPEMEHRACRCNGITVCLLDRTGPAIPRAVDRSDPTYQIRRANPRVWFFMERPSMLRSGCSCRVHSGGGIGWADCEETLCRVDQFRCVGIGTTHSTGAKITRMSFARSDANPRYSGPVNSTFGVHIVK